MSAGPGAGGYVGRFAPSPTGPLHAGSMAAALASWLDARAHGGRWLVRIEDVDTPRCVPGADTEILRQLAACGLHPDEPPVWQSRRGDLYARALDTLHAAGLAYGCRCTRREIALALAAAGHDRTRHGELVYPGTCRPGGVVRSGPWAGARAVRLLTVQPGGADVCIDWADGRLGPQHQNVTREVGDFVLRRADGLWAYQLAVVVDDAAQGITHVVRGEDLADNTPRQVWLQRCLGLPTPRHHHTPLVLDGHGEKLSKQTGATAIDTDRPLVVLQAAAQALDLVVPWRVEINQFLSEAVSRWTVRCQV
ncbi:tRNA glutamyl-Q(34) synthetase GluQRS [Sphaerotilus sp.]|uniref:tRNA glutamyl-Q(34) synthetase GluQRS n=1 Tax=Sphaerotilus sp. TaxID=2093942 RepID=UPI0034E20306